MPRTVALVALAVLAAAGRPARADEPISRDTIAALKAATVFVKVEGEGWGATGSGFVAAADPARLLVVTNHHVAAPRPTGPGSKPPAVTVVFGGGTPAERSFPATLAAADEPRDLAVLRVAGVKDAPRPVPYADSPKPVETTPVYTFGFPFGQGLATGERSPAVTVGGGTVSSLRYAADGGLSMIQIDGNLNPGNSGGPVVDRKGRLVGVAVARIREGQGIGFLVPAAEVGELMAGRVGRVRVVRGVGAGGKPFARVEAELADPLGRLTGPTAVYVLVPPKGTAPAPAALDAHPSARRLPLNVENGVGVAEIPVEKAEGSVVVRVTAGRGAGVPAASPPDTFSLAPPPKPEDLAGPPPAGWKDYAPGDRAFAVWLPEKPARQAADRRTFPLGVQTARASVVAGATTGGLVYRAETIEIPTALGRVTAQVYPAIRSALREETKGQITHSVEAKAVGLTGAEYRVEAGAEVTRVRAYIAGQRIFMVRVAGTSEQVNGAEAETILLSFRRPTPGPVAGPPSNPVNPSTPAAPPKVVAGAGTDPYFFGSNAADPKFKTVGPAGAVLVGVDVRFGTFGNTPITRALRPAYRVNGKEVPGEQFGNDMSGAVRMRAKDGYAVGGMVGKADWWCNGFALIYMKVKADGTLDPADSYEGEWAGTTAKAESVKVTGDGKPAVGIVGKIAGPETTALGLLFKGQEGYDPGTRPGPPSFGPRPGPGGKVAGDGKAPHIFGSVPDPQFKTVGPAGALLVGVEVRFEPFGRTPITRALRPIYRVNGKEQPGEQFGKDLTGAVVMKAKDGYAVGGAVGKAGLWCNGFALIYMKVKADGTLDPTDSYEGEWGGVEQKDGAVRVTGDGKPAVGIAGKIVGPKTTAFGVLFKGQEGWEPAGR